MASPTSRRAARVAASRPRRHSGALAALPRVAPRAAILVALVTATVVVPLSGGQDTPAVASTATVAVTVDYPTAVEVLSSGLVATTPTSLLAGVAGASRAAETVSRAVTRDVLPGCDGQARQASSNGQIPAADLCTLWDSRQMLRGDAAVALAELNQAFRAAFSRDVCLTDSYRTLAEQRRVAYAKPGLAATPGTSNHGWGLAIDLCSAESRNSTVMSWLGDNGPAFGWDNPAWARRGGSGAYEPWHWEYVPGTSAMGTDWGGS